MALLVPPEDLKMNGDLEETWPLFKQRFLLYMKATGAAQWPSDQKVALFLTVAGPEALQVYNSFQLDPAEEEDFEVVLARFERHCVPCRSEAYERFLFRTRFQEPHESLEDFLADLQRKCRFCNFGAQRESLVRDQVVLGCRDGLARQQLLQEDGLTLEGAVRICRLAEEEENKEAQTELRMAEKRRGQVSKRKVRRVRSLGNRMDSCWQQQCDDCLRKETFKTYV